MTLTYVIIDGDVVPNVDFSQVLETSAETVRWNIAGTQTFVKFDSSDPTPSFLEGKTQYTQAQILTELAKPEWTGPPVPPE